MVWGFINAWVEKFTVGIAHRTHGGHAISDDRCVLGVCGFQQRRHGAHEGPPAQREHVAVQRGVEA